MHKQVNDATQRDHGKAGATNPKCFVGSISAFDYIVLVVVPVAQSPFFW